MGTFIVGLILAGIVTAILVSIVRKKRKGGCVTCNCGDCCSGCASHAGSLDELDSEEK